MMSIVAKSVRPLCPLNISNIVSFVAFLSFYYFFPSINLSLPLNNQTIGYVSIMQMTKYIIVLGPAKTGWCSTNLSNAINISIVILKCVHISINEFTPQ